MRCSLFFCLLALLLISSAIPVFALDTAPVFTVIISNSAEIPEQDRTDLENTADSILDAIITAGTIPMSRTIPMMNEDSVPDSSDLRSLIVLSREVESDFLMTLDVVDLGSSIAVKLKLYDVFTAGELDNRMVKYSDWNEMLSSLDVQFYDLLSSVDETAMYVDPDFSKLYSEDVSSPARPDTARTEDEDDRSNNRRGSSIEIGISPFFMANHRSEEAFIVGDINVYEAYYGVGLAAGYHHQFSNTFSLGLWTILAGSLNDYEDDLSFRFSASMGPSIIIGNKVDAMAGLFGLGAGYIFGRDVVTLEVRLGFVLRNYYFTMDILAPITLDGSNSFSGLGPRLNTGYSFYFGQ